MMKMKKTAAFFFAMMAAASTMAMPVSAIQFLGGDMDGDDDVDAADAALILQYAAYVGSGGTDSIYDYIPPAETPDQGETEDTENKVALESMAGKTLADVMDAGYDVNGYMRYSDEVFVYADSADYTDDTITALVNSLTGKTVKEMVDEYDISIGYFGFNGEYEFFSTIGSIDVAYDLAHGAEAIANHEDETFFDLEEAEEIQSDVLENIRLSDVTFSIEFDDASRGKLLAAEDLDTTYIKSIADELIVGEMYYTTK